MFPVPADPAGVGGEVDDEVLAGDDLRARRRQAQVEPRRPRDGDVLRPRAAAEQLRDDGAPRNPAPPVTRIFFPANPLIP